MYSNLAVLCPNLILCKHHVGIQRPKCDAAGRTKLQVV